MFSSHDQRIPYAPRTLSTVEPNQWKPSVELAPNCPRCDSSDTKFCYYNNYSLTQPRYFCKGCRRYWTKGGSLRNVPFGGGCRKNRRPKPIRPPNDPATSGGDRSTYSRVPTNSLRPDLMLDDMVGNSRGPSAGGSTDSDGSSSIDLALLYAKFLNQCPGEDGVPFDMIGSSDSHHATAVQISNQGPSEGTSESPSSNENLVSVGGLSFWTDPSSNYAAAAAAAGGDISDVVSNLTWHEGFHPTPEDDVMLHQDLMTGDWTTLDQSTFDAF